MTRWLGTADLNRAASAAMRERPERWARHIAAERLVAALGSLCDAPATILWAMRDDAKGNLEVTGRLDGFMYPSHPELLVVRLDTSDPGSTAAHEYGHALVARGKAHAGRPLSAGRCDRIAERMGEQAGRMLGWGWTPEATAAALVTHFRHDLKGVLP